MTSPALRSSFTPLAHAPPPLRYPLRADFDHDKFPPLTRAAYKTMLKWATILDRQPNIAATVAQPEIGLKEFRDIQRGIQVVRLRALLGDMAAVVEFAQQMTVLVSRAKTGYMTPPAGMVVKASTAHQQPGLRRFNQGTINGTWHATSGSDDLDLDRSLSNGTLAEAEDLLYVCRHFHPAIMAAWRALAELLWVDLAVRHVYLTTSQHGPNTPLWRRVHGVTHAQVAMTYYFAVGTRRYEQEPWLLAAAGELGAKHGVTRVSPDEWRKVYEVMRDGIHADWDRIKGPDGRTIITWPHGNQRHYKAVGASEKDKMPVHSFTVYLPETWQRFFADYLGDYGLTTREDHEMMGNTVANCVHIDGWDTMLTSDDTGGGGLQDPAEEAKGAVHFREVRFRGGGSRPSRWHLSDRGDQYGDSRGSLISSHRGGFYPAMAFTTFPDRLEMIDTADKKVAQGHRVGLDLGRLMCCAVDEGVVRL